ncbi:terminase [Rhodococcus opacus]|uniref:Terminase n=1 Tax=Rhodococcus opacus TaxID=37919 RepID=A0A2S8JAT9_RHOOP|nr:terminase [Rhodococcus opacus]PQP24154.1 terminase [Rhodococcus opacus]
MARSRAATLIHTPDDEFAEIISWYEDLLANTAPPTDLKWEPRKIGPTWQWDDGWLLPEATLGWRVLAWCGKWLRNSKGEPWQFTPEQTRFLLWYYAVNPNGSFTHPNAVLQRLKGWGKDPTAACMALAAMFGEVVFDHWDGDRPVGREHPNAWVQVIAVSQEQTKNTMKLFPSLITPEAMKHYGIQVGKLNVYGLGDERQIQAVTSSYLAIEGARPTQIIRGETQNWTDTNQGHDMAGAIEGNVAKSDGGAARMIDICNAFRPHEDSVAQRVREAWEATQLSDDRDSDFVAADFGLLYDSLEAPPNAPMAGVSEEEIAEIIRSVAGDATWLDTAPDGLIVKSILNTSNPVSESRRKWFNQITAAEESWTTEAYVDQCDSTIAKNGKSRALEDGEKIVMFLDCSKSDDATALMGCAISDGYVFTIKIWQRPPQTKVWTVNRDDVDFKVSEAFDKYSVIGFWVDPSNAFEDESGDRYWDSYIDAWVERYAKKLKLHAVKAGRSKHPIIWDMRAPTHQELFVPATERFATDLKDGSLTFDGNKLLRQHMLNARRRPNKFGVGVGKENRESAKKIDSAVAAIGARLMWRQWTFSRNGKSSSKGRILVLE